MIETGSGVPFIISLVWTSLLVFYFIFLARAWAEYWWHTCDFEHSGSGWTISYSLGATLGYWPWTIPEGGNVYSWFMVQQFSIGVGTGSWQIRTYPLSAGALINYYKIAHHNKTSLRDAVIAIIIVAVLGQFIGAAWHIWMMAHFGGISKTNSWTWWMDYKAGRMVLSTWMNPQQTFGSILSWIGIGAVSAIIMYILRAKFAWFFLHPIAMASCLTYPSWSWLQALVALVLKLIGVRVIGAKRTYEYAVAFVAGYVWGYMIPYFPAGLYDFITNILPKLSALYVS